MNGSGADNFFPSFSSTLSFSTSSLAPEIEPQTSLSCLILLTSQLKELLSAGRRWGGEGRKGRYYSAVLGKVPAPTKRTFQVLEPSPAASHLSFIQSPPPPPTTPAFPHPAYRVNSSFTKLSWNYPFVSCEDPIETPVTIAMCYSEYLSSRTLSPSSQLRKVRVIIPI